MKKIFRITINDAKGVGRIVKVSVDSAKSLTDAIAVAQKFLDLTGDPVRTEYVMDLDAEG